MIQSYVNSPVSLTANDGSLAFQTDCIRTNSCNGCNSWLCHNCGSANYDIVKGGIYEINFNATVSSATAGDVSLALFNNGEMIPGTLMVGTLAAADDYVNLGITKQLRVCCNGNANITVRSVPAVPTPTAPATPVATEVPIIVNANLVISRTC